jgi:hypothetical protein
MARGARRRPEAAAGELLPDREGERGGRGSAWIRMEKRKRREEKRNRRERGKTKEKREKNN